MAFVAVAVSVGDCAPAVIEGQPPPAVNII